jgi:hypothetical protein
MDLLPTNPERENGTLTPVLSPSEGERENHPQSSRRGRFRGSKRENFAFGEFSPHHPLLRGGEGEGPIPTPPSGVDLLEVGLNYQPQHSQLSNESMGLFSKLSFLRGNHTFPQFCGLENFVHHGQPF